MKSFLVHTVAVGLLSFCICDILLAAKLPDFITVCNRKDPNISQCVLNAVNSLKPRLKSGIDELNVPSMEPLDIGDLNILDGGSAGISVKAKKLHIFGASNFDMKKFKVTGDGLRYDFELNLPHLQGEGNYDISGQILALPLKGNGPFTGNFNNFYAYVKIILEPVKKNGEDYLQIKDLKVKIRTGNGNINLQNLFNGDKSLGDVVNETINQNFELFTNELIVPIERALEKKFITITTKIIESYSYNELFPV